MCAENMYHFANVQFTESRGAIENRTPLHDVPELCKK